MTKAKWIQKIIGRDRRITSFEISSAYYEYSGGDFSFDGKFISNMQKLQNNK